MKIIFLLFISFLSFNAAPAKENALIKKVDELIKSEKAKTEKQLIAVGCYIILCHFEDKNGCKTQCNQFGQLTDDKPDDGFVDIPLDDDPVNEEQCSDKCVSLTHTKKEARKVCSSLCSTVFSYSNWRKYTKEAKDATRKAFKQLKTHIL